MHIASRRPALVAQGSHLYITARRVARPSLVVVDSICAEDLHLSPGELGGVTMQLVILRGYA